MYCWGSTIHGELGLGGIEDEHILCPRPLLWSGAKNVASVACGETHSLLATNDGKIYSCGNNDYGQLGHDQPRKRPRMSLFKLVSGLDSFTMTQVACGDSHSVAINQWGQVFSWGSDSHGQLGHQLDGENQPVPKIIRALATNHIVQISCGKKHSIALTNTGELYAWGANSNGQLGIGRMSHSECKPTLIKSLAGIPIASVVCGGDHSFVVSCSGAVYGWGKNTFGQLGLNNEISQVYPCQLKTLRTVKIIYIACGEEYSVFLTKDGGVFSCGSGSCGQLGHGTTGNEILPRKIMELMGSTITQVSCGRRHTLAFVPSRGRVYGFGLGGSGQIGVRQTRNATTPQIVLGPWVSPSGIPAIASPEESCVIKRIFAGGDHCFVTVSPENANVSPYDCREANPNTQILKLTIEQLNLCHNVTDNVDQDLWVYLETVFKSLACINGSFLLPNEAHYCCTSKHHGIDLTAAEQAFSAIGKIENNSIRDLILHCVTEDLLSQLIASPPDVESLRVYITLPFYHEFCNPKHHERLHRPFAQALNNLRPAPKKVIESWWNLCSVEYFERLIQVYKNVVCFILDLQKIPSNKTVSWDSSLVTALDILAQLNKLNHSLEGLKVPYDTFHLSNLDQYLDVRVDYVSWLMDQSSEKLYLCNYPFLFNAEAKTVLLQTDQTIQMQNAMSEAATRALLSLFHTAFRNNDLSQYLMLNVSRENLVLDTLRELTEVNTSDLRKPLKVKFLGEEADDAGGVRKEFFMLLLREIFDPKYGMFKEYEESRILWFSEDSFEDEVMYLLIGILCGLAIYNFTIIDLPFPLALYKKLLEEPVTLSDIRELSPMVANSLQHVLNYNEPDLEEVFSLHFEISKEVFGETKVVPLKPNGENIPVTLENKNEYVDLYVDYIFNKSVEKHYNAFSRGFLKVCGGRVLKLFHAHELKAVIVGNQNYDWHVLESGAEYKNDYSSSDQTIHWFWEVFHEMTEEEKKKFLLFLTGTDRIPITGMKSVKITIQPTTDEKFLPVAHTCFNLLDLPRYKTKERLRYKLLQAIQQTEGFSLV